MTTAQSSIRMSDQRGRLITLDYTVRQDGRLPGVVSPGKRTRFKVRTNAVAYRVERIRIDDSSHHWHVYDINIGGRSMFTNLGDSPEEDGVSGVVFSLMAEENFLNLDVVQIGADLALDVGYTGPDPGGAPFVCSLHCSVA